MEWIHFRWEPDSQSFGSYVWLPLFIDPHNPESVKVVWYDSWRLDNVTSPFTPTVHESEPMLGTSGSSQDCAANYGKNTSCCGQPSVFVKPKYRCPASTPICVDYVYGEHWGHCMPVHSTA